MSTRIAFLGRMGSGKTSLSKKCVELLNCKKISLGDELKADVLKYHLVPGKLIDKARDRHILQFYGQLRRGEVLHFEYCNGSVSCCNGEAWITPKEKMSGSFNLGLCYPDYWVHRMIQKEDDSRDTPLLCGNYVNDDIRRRNELEVLKTLGFLMVKVNVDEEIRLQRLIARDGDINEATLEDISESEIDSLPYDVAIDNNVTLKEAWNTLLNVI